MTHLAASIDLGSHTARLLIARRSGLSPWGWTPLVRRRAYIRLTADGDSEDEREIGLNATARALDALAGFSRLIAEYHVADVRAVATGVIRDSINGDRFLALLYEKTGIRIALISGEREAVLSASGARAALNMSPPCLVFDLGGGTTEFFTDMGGEPKAISLPIGAAVLTRRWFASDPPGTTDLDAIAKEIDRHLNAVAEDITGVPVIVGTGGTVTALAAMVHGMAWDDISPERVNGLILTLPQLEACLAQMKTLTIAERVQRLGLDAGRAEVIVAGALATIGILRFVGISELRVSMSDLLEGLLIEG